MDASVRLQAVYTALKETESRSTDLLPLWKVLSPPHRVSHAEPEPISHDLHQPPSVLWPPARLSSLQRS